MAKRMFTTLPLKQYRKWLELPPDERPANAYDTTNMPMAFASGGCPHKAFANGPRSPGGLCIARLKCEPAKPAFHAGVLLFNEIGYRGLNPSKFNFIELGLALGNTIARDTFYRDMPGLPRQN
jgi:hypothetical protein